MRYLNKLIQRLKRIFYGYTTPRCVGLDISSTAIKLVELKEDSFIITKYRIYDLLKNQVSEGVINDIENVAAGIRNTWEDFKSKYEDVAIAIPQNAVIMRELKIPDVTNTYKIDEYVKDQLTKDLDTEDIDFDYVIKNLNSNEKIASVLIAKKEKIEEYQAVIQMSNIKVAAIDVENFALQFLFERIIPEKFYEQHIIFLELAATRIKGFVFLGRKFILFNEMTVNYNNLIEEVVVELGDPGYIKHFTNCHVYLDEIIISKKVISQNLISAISSDAAKMLQQLKSSALVEKKMNLSTDAVCYLFGGNVLIPGVFEAVKKTFSSPPLYATELLESSVNNYPKKDLVRLFTAIALASWGQNIDKN